ncbi:MAG TPA: response regulator [Solirubrobacteraceae bacterium]|nr:response regulator [Solirubrobacteraceae bacterium]
MSAAAPARLLIVDDEAPQMRALCDILAQEGYVTQGFTAGREALAALRAQPFDVLLTDLMMPQIDGITLLRACHEIDRDLACLVMTGHATVSTAVEALKAGALDYVMKPFNVNHILAVLTRALGVRRLQVENIQLRESVSIYELARAITQGLDHAAVIERTLAAAAAQSDAGAAYLLIPGADEDRTLVVAGMAGPTARPLSAAPLLREPLGEWLATASVQLDALAQEAEAPVLFAHPFDAAIAVALPLVTAGKLFGVLGFSPARSQRRVSVGQLKALDVLARTAATAFAAAALVSELKTMNEELELRVEQRTHELEIANKDLESFSYSISHDLREPLRAVEGFCEIFRAEFGAGVPEEGRAVLARIAAGASRMTQLVNDLLHFSRFSREPLQRVSVPMRELVQQVLTRLTEALGARPVSVQVGDLPDCCADPRLLEQVWVNLLSNAFKFTAGRDPARVEIGALHQGTERVYYVRDNGVGFDMRYAAKLFGVFQRLHSVQEFEGTGVGLSIVHRIVTRHGGRVWADSRLGEGTTFYFTLTGPAAAQAGPAAAQSGLIP